MNNKTMYAATAAVLVVTLPFELWWLNLGGFWHWQGIIAGCGLFAFGWMAQECWERHTSANDGAKRHE